MAGLAEVVERLSAYQVAGELWVDGSFLTEKINPGDVDIVLRVPSSYTDDGTIKQRRIVDWIDGNLREHNLCDSYVFYEFPDADPNYLLGEEMRDYWSKWFGHSRDRTPKGIAVIELTGDTP
jgi:hypothetical protein